MAIFSLSVEAYSRSRGQSMIAKAAYRAGSRLRDERTGVYADYTRRSGVEASFMMFPRGVVFEREDAWNRVEAAEKRKDSCVGRQVLFALPCELTQEGRERCARRYGDFIVQRFETFVDIALHRPGRDGDQRNHHVHLLMPTRQTTSAGLGKKIRELDDRIEGPKLITLMRETWATIANEELAAEAQADRIDHKSNRDRGIEEKPSIKMGLAAISIERKTGQSSLKRRYIEQPIEEDEALLKAIVAYEVDQAERLDVPSDRKPIDIDAVLQRLKSDATIRIKTAIAECIRSRRRILSTPLRARDRTDRLQRRKTIPIFHGSAIHTSSHGWAKHFPLRDTMKPSVDRDLSHQDVANAPFQSEVSNQPTGAPRLDRLALTKTNGFLIAAAGVLSSNVKAEADEFIRWAVDLMAAEFTLGRADLAATVAHYRSLAPTFFKDLTQGSSEILQRYVDAVGRLIAQTRERRQIYPPSPGRKLHAHIDDDLAQVLKITHHAEQLIQSRNVLHVAEANSTPPLNRSPNNFGSPTQDAVANHPTGSTKVPSPFSPGQPPRIADHDLALMHEQVKEYPTEKAVVTPSNNQGIDHLGLLKAHGLFFATVISFSEDSADLDTFIRRAIDSIVAGFGLTRADILGAISNYKSITPAVLNEVTRDLFAAIQRYVDALGILIEGARTQHHVAAPFRRDEPYPQIRDDLNAMLQASIRADELSDRERLLKIPQNEDAPSPSKLIERDTIIQDGDGLGQHRIISEAVIAQDTSSPQHSELGAMHLTADQVSSPRSEEPAAGIAPSHTPRAARQQRPAILVRKKDDWGRG